MDYSGKESFVFSKVMAIENGHENVITYCYPDVKEEHLYREMPCDGKNAHLPMESYHQQDVRTSSKHVYREDIPAREEHWNNYNRNHLIASEAL